MEGLFIMLFFGIILSPLIFVIWFMLTVTKRLKEISSETRRIATMLEKQNPQTNHNPHSYYQN